MQVRRHILETRKTRPACRPNPEQGPRRCLERVRRVTFKRRPELSFHLNPRIEDFFQKRPKQAVPAVGKSEILPESFLTRALTGLYENLKEVIGVPFELSKMVLNGQGLP